MFEKQKYWLWEAEYYCQQDPACRSRWEAYFLYPGIRALRRHQRAQGWLKKGWHFLARWYSERTKTKTGIEIHPAAKIGKNVFIDHGTGIVIGETAVVGDRVLIYHNVTLGGTSSEKDVKRHPTIEHDASIGAGAKILGNVTIGHHAKVGANAVVLTDVPPYATAVGIPARIIEKEKPETS